MHQTSHHTKPSEKIRAKRIPKRLTQSWQSAGDVSAGSQPASERPAAEEALFPSTRSLFAAWPRRCGKTSMRVSVHRDRLRQGQDLLHSREFGKIITACWAFRKISAAKDHPQKTRRHSPNSPDWRERNQRGSHVTSPRVPRTEQLRIRLNSDYWLPPRHTISGRSRMIPEPWFSARWCRLRLVGGTAIGTDWRPFASLRLASPRFVEQWQPQHVQTCST
jgi:hypothetical protein